ncbi:predicted protein [Phaeodactylum tricornutum CCAP 1055/1]|uniref:Transmembrane protein n=1 Tax=Phaeodactylum tricornutum (strain CCAP 1055/1) TaxID=556484 RepID=B5Y4B0_PHATC|nr:predicted protein [Phaeodactylum tricornutum CCAP 1055/1]ACI65446.1 predicted protein [Phaeodactylum tricornutum CCAP 1055/1]|eukprot:XP_002185976.1 predicted protein [Phaeodactylum tricornutum CCAP 1055/1]
MNAFTTGPESTAADRHNRRATGISSEAEERRMETLEIMNTPVENDAEEENDDDDEEEEAMAPVAGWRFWWIFARFPLGLLLVNTILLALITLYNLQYSPSYIVGNSTHAVLNDDFDSDERRDFGLAQFSALELQSWIVKCGMVALLACLDAIVFYWFTVRLKKGMELLARKAQQEEPQGRPVANENLNRPRTAPLHKLDLNYSELDLVHARGPSAATDRPNLGQPVVPTDGTHSDCLSDCAITFDIFVQLRRIFHVLEEYHITVRMAEKEHHGWDSYMDTETLVATNVNGNLTVYSQLHEPHSFVSINEGSGETMEGFCFLYTEFVGHDDEEIYEYTTQAVACVSSNENISQGFRNTTLLNSDGGGWLESVGKAHDGRYWIRLQEDRFVDEWSSYQEVLHIIQLDPQSMMYTVVANSTSFPDFQQPLRNEGSRCFRWTSGIGYVAAAISLFLSALVLLLFIKTKSGAGCLALSIFAVRLWLEETWLDMLSPVLLVFTFICLCTASLSLAVREMVLWGIYSVIVVQLVLAFVNREFPVMGTIGLGMGLALDHPVLQLGGWIGAPLSVCILLYYAIVGYFGNTYGGYFYYDRQYTTTLLIVACIPVSCSLVVLSEALLAISSCETAEAKSASKQQ